LNAANGVTSHVSSRTFLAGVGAKLNEIGLFGPIHRQVKIKQKTVKDSPTEKLYDSFIGILCGAQGMVEVNKRVRSDRGLQQAFGRERCAEQSVIQETLDASDAESVNQLQQAMNEIYRHHSQGYRHDYQQQLQILDVDMSGQPCGPKAAFATKGYFAGKRNRKGRQLGRVLATRYDEVVCDQIEIEQAPEKRARTLVRVDSGGGSLKDINWLLSRGYQVLTKDYSTQRARKFAKSVTEWFEDPTQPGRQFGFVTTPATDDYCQPVIRIAVRCRKNNGHWAVGVLVTNLTPTQVATLMNTTFDISGNLSDLWLMYVHCYDQRGGGVETAFKQDNQALGIKKRNKKRFHAQQMLTQLNALAHNVLVWAKHWLTAETPALKKIGFVRLIRDVFTTTGQLLFNAQGRLVEIRLNAADTLVRPWIHGLSLLLKSEQVDVNLGKT